MSVCLCCGDVLGPWPHRGRMVARLDKDGVLQLAGEVCASCAFCYLDDLDNDDDKEEEPWPGLPVEEEEPG